LPLGFRRGELSLGDWLFADLRGKLGAVQPDADIGETYLYLYLA